MVANDKVTLDFGLALQALIQQAVDIRIGGMSLPPRQQMLGALRVAPRGLTLGQLRGQLSGLNDLVIKQSLSALRAIGTITTTGNRRGTRYVMTAEVLGV